LHVKAILFPLLLTELTYLLHDVSTFSSAGWMS